MKIKHIYTRGKKYYFRMLIPVRLRTNPKLTHISISLKTEDPDEAAIRAIPYRRHYKKLFSAPAGTPITTPLTLPELRAEAEANGLTYRDHEQMAAAPVRESFTMMNEIINVAKIKKTLDDTDLQVLGGVLVSRITMSKAFERCKQISEEKSLGKNHVEEKKYWDRYTNGIEDFISEMGDMDILEIKPKDAFEYKNKLVKRLKEARKRKESEPESKGKREPTSIDTMNKKMMACRVVINTVFEVDFPERIHSNPFARTSIKNDEDEGKRPAFTEDEVKAINEKKATSTANEELKAIMTIAELTGAGCKELCLLTASDIHISDSDPIGYISIRPNAHRSKVKSGGQRHRDVPLLPRAVEALRPFAQTGFPRYCHPKGHTALSAVANKFIEPVVGKGKTFNSYRHRMANLLKVANGVTDTQKDGILGHSLPGMRGQYGDDIPLEVKYEVLLKALPNEAPKAE